MRYPPRRRRRYTSQLTNITKILLGSGAKHVQYALTTPFEADAQPACGPYCSPGRVNLTMAGPPAHRDGLDARLRDGATWPQPINGGNGRCGPPMCEPGSIGCGVPNKTAKALGPDPSAPGCGPPTYAVTKLNERAEGVMTSLGVPMLDLNTLVHDHCGATYHNCSLCDDETKYMGIRCGYHYAPAGVDILANAVADSFKKLLGVV